MAIKKQADQTHTKKDRLNVCTRMMLFSFKADETKSGWYRFSAKMNSAPINGEKYGAGVFITIMAKPDSCMIEDAVTGENQWLLVSGQLNAEDYQTKDGLKGTGLTLWADTIAVAPPKRG